LHYSFGKLAQLFSLPAIPFKLVSILIVDRGPMNAIFEILDDGGYYVHMIYHGRVLHSRYEWSALTKK
jgi:hypothetical protein